MLLVYHYEPHVQPAPLRAHKDEAGSVRLIWFFLITGLDSGVPDAGINNL